MNPQKYRWVTVGQPYVYRPRLGKGDDSRRLSVCEVVAVPRPGAVGNVLVRWLDGHTATVPAGVLRKVATT